MDAIVLVGGQGTRLLPLTATRHKSLVPLCNRPAIGYLFEWLRMGGFDRAVLAIGQNNDDLARAYPAGEYEGLEIVLVQEQERLESGGAIRNAVRTAGITGRFAVLNGDVFVDFDFKAALAAHVAHSADLTLALYEMDDPSQFGVAVLDEEGLVTGFVEKPPPGTAPGKLVNAGVWIFEPGLVGEIPPGAVRVEETLFPSLVGQRRRVLGYRFEGLWADIGTWQRYLALNQALLPTGANSIDLSAIVSPRATVRGSSVGAMSEVLAGAQVCDSILWERVRVHPGAEVVESILADGVVIEAGARVTGAVIGSGAVVSSGTVVAAGTSINGGTRYDGSYDC